MPVLDLDARKFVLLSQIYVWEPSLICNGGQNADMAVEALEGGLPHRMFVALWVYD
jgi:hypothetical protein